MSGRIVTLWVVVGALVASACTAESPRTEASDRRLVVGVPVEGPGPPWFSASTWGLGYEVQYQAYETLLTYETRDGETNFGKAAPWLAESWEVQDGGHQIVFRLREGVTFATGREMTAEDVEYSFTTLRDCPEGEVSQSGFAIVNLQDATTQVIDDHTIAFNLPKGLARTTLALLATNFLPILDSEEVVKLANGQKCSLGAIKNETFGTGPYFMESRKPGEEVILRARDDYWGGDVYFQRVIYKIVPDPNTRLLLLRQGEVGLVWDIPASRWAEIDRSPNLKLNYHQRLDPHFLSILTTEGPTSDVNLRRALIKAFPYDTVIDEVLSGFAENTKSFARPGTPWYKSYDLHTQDLEEAKDFLSKSSYRSGTPLTLTVDKDDSLINEVAVWYQDALEQIGVTLKIEPVPIQTLLDKGSKHELMMVIHNFQSWIDDLAYWLFFNATTDSIRNFGGLSNSRLDQIVEEAMSIPGYDDPKAIELLTEAQDIIAEEAAMAPLFLTGPVNPSREEITGYSYVYFQQGEDLRQLARRS
jgi:peptide/nickel transport system substrate-binding protein